VTRHGARSGRKRLFNSERCRSTALVAAKRQGASRRADHGRTAGTPRIAPVACGDQKKRRHRGASRGYSEQSADQLADFTSNERVDTGLPSSAISTWYLPAGQAFGFWILNVVTAGPVVAIDWLIALTS